MAQPNIYVYSPGREHNQLRFYVVNEGATQTSGVLIAPRIGQIIVIERAWWSVQSAASVANNYNFQLSSVDAAGNNPVQVWPLINHINANVLYTEQGDTGLVEIPLIEQAGLGWAATVGGPLVAFTAVTIAVMGRIIPAGHRTVRSSRFQPAT